MAEISKGILGGFSGTVGPVVGASWRGKNIIRSRPKASQKEPTSAQEEQRQKFQLVSQFLQPLSPLLNDYFGTKSGVVSRKNQAMSYHLKEACTYTGNTAEILYNKVLISKGDLYGLNTVSAVMQAGSSIQLEWDNNSDQGNAQATDQLFIAIHNAAKAETMYVLNIGSRSDTSATVRMPDYYTGDEVYLWIGIAGENKKNASTSQYLGVFTVL